MGTMQWLRFEELSAAALYELLQFRQAIFVVEQRSPYPDLDGRDRTAAHLLLREGGELAGYLRLIPAPQPMIGRVAVAAARRRQGLARKLMREALAFAARHYPGQPVALSAQNYLVPFYEGFGFAVVSEPYDDFGVLHVDMAKPAG